MTGEEKHNIEYKQKWSTDCLKAISAMANSNGRITNSDYQKVNNVSERTALRDLEDLILKKVVLKKGEKKGTHYRLV